MSPTANVGLVENQQPQRRGRVDAAWLYPTLGRAEASGNEPFGSFTPRRACRRKRLVASKIHGQIVILNGAPRAGKSSIVSAMQERFEGVWMNLGVDVHARGITPRRYQPGVGLRPGEPDHIAAPWVAVFYAALYESIAAHSRVGLNVVVDVGHYDAGILTDCARRLDGLPVLFVGVRCATSVIMERRNASPDGYAIGPVDDPPPPVLQWQREVHLLGIYDLEVDTGVLTPEQAADAIARRLIGPTPPKAFAMLARGGA
jgi:chloramphenicol 3-O phosphotransferase